MSIQTKRIIYIFTLQLFLLPLLSFSQSDNLIEIAGKVTDQQSRQPLPDVSVSIKGTVTGTITNATGNFVLRTKEKLPFILLISSVGFKQQEFEVKTLGSNLQIALSTQTVLGSEPAG
jgi:iron complex outermembrane receptor protein